MTRKLKKTIGVISIVLILIVLAIVYMLSLFGRPLYQPGMVVEGKNITYTLEPPTQEIGNDSFWHVDNNINLYHFSQGAEIPVLMIHGGPGMPFREPMTGLSPLTDEFEFIYYDQRGCGKSSRPIDTFSSSDFYQNMVVLDAQLGLGAQIADVERIRQIIEQDEIYIIGHSFGAFLASLYAAEFPEHVKGLVLVAPASVLVLPTPEGDLYELVAELIPEEMKDSYADYRERYFDFRSVFSKSEKELIDLNNEFAQYYIAAMQGKNESPTELIDGHLNGGWMVQAMFFSMGKKHDYRKALLSVEAPVLIIHGEEDLQPVSVSEMYARSFPNAEIKIIKNAGHFPFVEQPEEFSKIVGAFLKN